MVWQRLGLNKTLGDIAENLCVHPATVKRMADLFELTGDVCKRPYPSANSLQKKLTSVIQLLLLMKVIEQPGIKLNKLQSELNEYGVK